MERGSVLLGHRRIRATEKHYSPWTRSRQEQLEADLERSWAADPVVLHHNEGLRGGHREKNNISKIVEKKTVRMVSRAGLE